MKRKFKIGNETLYFEITNKTIFDIDERFDNFGTVINGVMYGQNVYNNALKVMVCSCVSKRLDEEKNENPLTIDELREKLTPDQIVEEIVTFASDLYYDYRGVKRSTENENTEEESKKK
ncbi:MAG: RNA polymerase subunit sigma [Paraclostridium bifermentans]|uniref:RNA polymerase subunit sigma n=1 Tax=Paraclostridium bifermentans TaxID=1490 RepID=UPI001DFCEDCC|nr:RNA polymerase subunit sigma [Paraclostridium bifermentans]MBS6509709.1 RNA polymerase subunit sigma [Paraclostridium bifermentans]